jgi:hypothetical protein
VAKQSSSYLYHLSSLASFQVDLNEHLFVLSFNYFYSLEMSVKMHYKILLPLNDNFTMLFLLVSPSQGRDWGGGSAYLHIWLQVQVAIHIKSI